jgi:hypothetical protein
MLEWHMQNGNVSLIEPKLFLGGCDVLQAFGNAFIREFGIRLIVSCAQEIEYSVESIPILRVPLQDRETQKLWPDILIASHAIEAAHNAGGAVLVICAAKVSRSAAVVLFHLMRTQKLTLDEAFDKVAARRKCINPNPGFVDQLRAMQQHLRCPSECQIELRPIPKHLINFDDEDRII